MKCLQHILFLLLILLSVGATAQIVRRDSTIKSTAPKDTIVVRTDTIARHIPRKATFRSAVLPGWGQAYNKEYWKIPIVYTAIGIPAGFFIYNNTWYKRTKKAYEILVTNDTASFPKIHPKLKQLSADNLRFYRNEFRRDRDYSILYTLIAWGLNVVDATVFAHLKEFDVSDDLSLKLRPRYNPIANTTGLSLVLAVKKTQRNLSVVR